MESLLRRALMDKYEYAPSVGGLALPYRHIFVCMALHFTVGLADACYLFQNLTSKLNVSKERDHCPSAKVNNCTYKSLPPCFSTMDRVKRNVSLLSSTLHYLYLTAPGYPAFVSHVLQCQSLMTGTPHPTVYSWYDSTV